MRLEFSPKEGQGSQDIAGVGKGIRKNREDMEQTCLARVRPWRGEVGDEVEKSARRGELKIDLEALAG